MSDALNSRVARFEANEANLDAWVKGDASTSVDFGGGAVRSPAKLIADSAAAIAAKQGLPGRYQFVATAGQSEWTPPAGITIVPGTVDVYVNGAHWNRIESFDDSTTTKVTFVNPLALGAQVAIVMQQTMLLPVSGVGVVDLATAAAGKGADMVGFAGANGIATTVSALASPAGGKGSALIAHGSSTLAQVIDPDNQSAAAALTGAEEQTVKQGGSFVATTLASIASFVLTLFALLISTGPGAAARTIVAWLRDQPVSVKDFGAKCDGVADDTAAVLAASTFAASIGVPIYVVGVCLVSGNVTLPSSIKSDGGRLKVAATSTLTVNGDIIAIDNAGLFDCAVTAHVYLTASARVSVGWLYGPRDGTLDVSRFMNDAIASAPSSGREIFIPINAWRLKAETVTIGLKNFITISGASSGERSGIEYEKAAPVGQGATAEFPGGGSALLVDKTLSLGISLPVYSTAYANYRVSGLTLKNFRMSGSNFSVSQGIGLQNGISISGASDGTTIDGLCMISFSGLALEADNLDCADIGNCWIQECANAVSLGGNPYRCRVSNMALGANWYSSNGTCLHLTGANQCSFTNIGFFAGAQSLVLDGGCNFNQFSNCRINNIYTGQVLLNSASENIFSGLGIYIESTESADPLARDDLFGVIQNTAGDSNLFIGLSMNVQLPADYVGIRWRGGSNNTFIGGTLWGNASTQKIRVENGNASLIVSKLCKSGEIAYDSTAQPSVDFTAKSV